MSYRKAFGLYLMGCSLQYVYVCLIVYVCVCVCHDPVLKQKDPSVAFRVAP